MKEDDPLAWIEKAEEDWVAANALLRRKNPFTGIVCFHFQQSAEKYLKAILVLKGSAFPKTHDLTGLSNMCEEAGVSWGWMKTPLIRSPRMPQDQDTLAPIHRLKTHARLFKSRKRFVNLLAYSLS